MGDWIADLSSFPHAAAVTTTVMDPVTEAVVVPIIQIPAGGPHKVILQGDRGVDRHTGIPRFGNVPKINLTGPGHTMSGIITSIVVFADKGAHTDIIFQDLEIHRVRVTTNIFELRGAGSYSQVMIRRCLLYTDSVGDI
jgi:hypothetical protein